MEGRVKWFNNVAGMGYIAVEDHPDVFFHRSEILAPNVVLGADELVEFDVVEDEQGVHAANVTPLE